MRNLVLSAVLLLLAACSTPRGAGRSPSAGAVGPTTGETPVASAPRAGPSTSAPYAAPYSAPMVSRGGPTDAASLARETGLTYADDGRTVLLSSADVRARIYPATGTLTIDGRGVTMGAPARREGGLVVVPAVGADAVRRAVSDAASRRTSMPKPVALVPLPPMAAPQKPALRPVDLTPAPSRADASGDPSWTPAVASRGWKWIVVHHSDDHTGCFAKYDRVHRAKGWEGCGYHFVIGNGTESGDGEVETTDRWATQMHGAHAKTDDNRFNDYGVGIVLVGDFERGGQPTDRQYRALVRLTKWLMAKNGISADRVLRHSDCKSTACPGKNFPWSRYIADISDGVATPP